MLSDNEILVLFSVFAALFLVCIYLFITLRKTRNQLKNQEQAIAHLAIALETITSGSESSEAGEKTRSTSAIIGGIAGGVWEQYGVQSV